MGTDLMVKCSGAHSLCDMGGPCPYCEPVYPLRDTDGRFVSMKDHVVQCEDQPLQE